MYMNRHMQSIGNINENANNRNANIRNGNNDRK